MGNGYFVDFDRNLNVCVAQIRATLNDDSDAPRFIQTVPKRGYKFIAPVERVELGAAPERPFRSVPRPYLLLISKRRWPRDLPIVVLYVKWHRPLRPERTMIATLPFENLTGDPKEDLFTDGLTEELIGQLGG